jgi:DNA (cytosine-5)-methyltransferase 1
MPDALTTAERSALMRRIHGAGTGIETAFCKALRARGARFSRNASNLPGKPDIALQDRRLAVFLDGDFWHGAQWRRRGLPELEDQFADSPNRAYWLRKIRRNMQRDCRTASELVGRGWTVLRLWESELSARLDEHVDFVLADHARAADAPCAAQAADKTVAEFFAGIGLVRMGLERAGWRVVFANDNDESKRALYAGNAPDADEHFRFADVRDLRGADVPAVALATASFPCTDVSIAGAQRGLAGRHSSMFWEFVRVVEELGARRPPLVMLENVVGLLGSHEGRDFRACVEALNRLGYVVDAFTLDALHFVPQSRPRLFILGIQRSLAPPADDRWTSIPADEPSCPTVDDPRRFRAASAPGRREEPTSRGASASRRREKPPDQGRLWEGCSPDVLRPKKLIDAIRRSSDVDWALRRLPDPPQRQTRLADLLEDLPDDHPAWWNDRRAAYLLSQMSARDRAEADAMIASPGWRYGAVFRRMRRGKSTAEMRTDGVAGCLRTPRGGSARQILFKAGQGRYAVRLLTPRECARLMGADDFRITGSTTRALFGFGDAVCVPAIEWIATRYLNPLVSEMIHGRPLRARSGWSGS